MLGGQSWGKCIREGCRAALQSSLFVPVVTPFSFPEAAPLFFSTKNRCLLEGPILEVCDPQTSNKCDWARIQDDYSAHAPKIGQSKRSGFLVLGKRSAECNHSDNIRHNSTAVFLACFALHVTSSFL